MNGSPSWKSPGTQANAGDVLATDRPATQASSVDLAEFEKFFREQFATGGERASPAGSAKPAADDPLMAELARIVGQEVRPSAAAASTPRMPQAHDVFAAPAPPPAQNDPLKAFEEELRRFDAEREAARLAASPEPALRGPIDPEPLSAESMPDMRRADLEQALHAPAPAQMGMEPRPDLPGDSLAVAPEVLEEHAEESKPRSRKVMIMLTVAGVVALAGVVGTLGFGGRSKPTGSEAPVIAAKPGPTKEAPANPGGVEISGQDRQVLARRTEEQRSPAAVVNKEEQPVDLNQTPKREAARVILPPTSGQPGAPAAPILVPSGSQPPAQAQPAQMGVQSSSAPSVEPKRVRSVRVSGEGEVSAPAAPAAPSAAPRQPVPVAAAPQPAAPSSAAPSSAQPKNDARPTTAVRTVTATPSATTPQPARPATPRPAAPAQPQAESQNEDGPVNLRPPSAAPRATTPVANAGGTGAFSVQMKASPSEEDARAAASDFKRRHAGALGSHSPAVRQATVDGRTVYRVRVGGLSRESATSLCNRIKADGGSCFVASN